MSKIRKMLAMLAVLCLTAACICMPVSAEDDAAMLAEAKHGVVQILGRGYSGSTGSGRPESGWSGSGFAVGITEENETIFLTNSHVVTADGDYDEEHVRLWVLLQNAELQENHEPNPEDAIECEVLYVTDGYPDVAVLKVVEAPKEFRVLPLMSSEEVLDGARVYALGYPGIVDAHSGSTSGADDVTITTGIISKHMVLTSAQDTKVLLHDAHIQSGNSGGPLITSAGAVVGLNTYGFGQDTSTEYSCAVYADYAMDALTDLELPFTVYEKKTAVETKPMETEPVETDPMETEPMETESMETEVGDLAEDNSGETDKADIVQMAAIAAGAVTLAAVLLLILHRRRKRRKSAAKAAEEEKPSPAVPEEPVCFAVTCPDGRVVQVGTESMLIGRHPNCRIRLPEGTKGVSREHCRLEVKKDTLILTDVGSSYGTFVNGKKIPENTPVVLHRGSSFWLATEKITFYVQ